MLCLSLFLQAILKEEKNSITEMPKYLFHISPVMD